MIQLTATEDCWVLLTSPGDGAQLFMGVIPAGSSRTWTEKKAVDVRLGNPGGVVLTVNGQRQNPDSTVPVTLSFSPSTELAARDHPVPWVGSRCVSTFRVRSRPPRTVSLVTLGCARNEVDSEELAARLTAAGWELTSDGDASVVLVNTCGFIQAAKQESIDELLAAAESGAKVAAVGCLAERYGAELAE